MILANVVGCYVQLLQIVVKSIDCVCLSVSGDFVLVLIDSLID